MAACREHGFGVLLSPLTVRDGRIVDMSGHAQPITGLPFVIDNGVWSCHVAGVEWTEAPMRRLVERIGLSQPGGYWREGLGRGFLVLPDFVGDGQASLARSIAWWTANRNGWVSDCVATYLLAVQDGMTVAQVRDVLETYRISGVFVGGSTSWKWATVHDWAELGLDIGVTVHVGRVNSLRRAMLCRDLGISSFDGSSVSRYADTAPKLARACDGTDLPLPPPGRAREHLSRPQHERIVEIEPRARHAIAERRFRLALGAAA